MSNRLSGLWLAFALAAAPAHGQQALKAGEGAVVFTYTPPAGAERSLAVFTFAPFDAASGHLVYAGKTATHTPQLKDWPLTGLKLPAGKYVLREVFIYSGANPHYCFGPATAAFDVAPGQVTYVGALTFAAAPPPQGFLKSAIGIGGQWLGQVKLDAGDRAAAQAGLPKLFKAPLAESGGMIASFAVEGRPKSEVGGVCASSKQMP